MISPQDTNLLVSPRSAVALPNPGIATPRWGYLWKIGSLFGQRVAYTFAGVNLYQTVNLRFLDAGVTVIVLSNDMGNDGLGTAMNTAALLFGQRPAPKPAIQTTAPPALLGTYHRVFQDADRRAAHDAGLGGWVGSIFTITIKTGWIVVARLDLLEYYTASRDGQLTVLGYLPTNGGSFCSMVPHRGAAARLLSLDAPGEETDHHSGRLRSVPGPRGASPRHVDEDQLRLPTLPSRSRLCCPVPYFEPLLGGSMPKVGRDGS